MKKIILSILFATSIFGVELDWTNNYNEAEKLAKKENKDIYLFIGADVCRYCDRFKKETLSKKYIMDELKENFVPVYLSRDQHEVPDKFQVFGAPRHYFLTADGEIFDEDMGFLAPKKFFSLLKEIKFYK